MCVNNTSVFPIPLTHHAVSAYFYKQFDQNDSHDCIWHITELGAHSCMLACVSHVACSRYWIAINSFSFFVDRSQARHVGKAAEHRCECDVIPRVNRCQVRCCDAGNHSSLHRHWRAHVSQLALRSSLTFPRFLVNFSVALCV